MASENENCTLHACVRVVRLILCRSVFDICCAMCAYLICLCPAFFSVNQQCTSKCDSWAVAAVAWFLFRFSTCSFVRLNLLNSMLWHTSKSNDDNIYYAMQAMQAIVRWKYDLNCTNESNRTSAIRFLWFQRVNHWPRAPPLQISRP